MLSLRGIANQERYVNRIIHLFAKSKSNEFLRIILFNNNLSLSHIRNNKIIQKIEIGLIDKMTILDYINQHPILPVDIIISNNTISCRSIYLNNLKEKDIVTLAKNILNKKDNLINLICYEKKLSYRSGVVSFCEMKLTPILSKILQQMLSIKNTLNAITATPIWIVSNYFMKHPTEQKQFKAQIFVIKMTFSKEIISLHDGKYVYYRKISIDNFDEKVEVNNALDFVNQLFNVNLKDVAIYSLNEDTIDTFTTLSHIDMQVISKFDELIRIDKKKEL